MASGWAAGAFAGSTALKFLTDEHIPPALARGLRRALPDVNVLELRDTKLLGQPDPVVLAWAAEHERILITRDVHTVPDYAWERVQEDMVMPGVFIWRREASLHDGLEALVLVIQASQAAEWAKR